LEPDYVYIYTQGLRSEILYAVLTT